MRSRVNLTGYHPIFDPEANLEFTFYSFYTKDKKQLKSQQASFNI